MSLPALCMCVREGRNERERGEKRRELKLYSVRHKVDHCPKCQAAYTHTHPQIRRLKMNDFFLDSRQISFDALQPEFICLSSGKFTPSKSREKQTSRFFYELFYGYIMDSCCSKLISLSLSHTHTGTRRRAPTHIHARQQETEIFLNRNHTVSYSKKIGMLDGCLYAWMEGRMDVVCTFTCNPIL